MKDWRSWAAEVTLGVQSVPDELLQRAAAMLRSASIVLTAGNGGSSALASHAAQALMKPGYAAGGGVAAVCLTDMVPTLTAHANDGGWETALVECARPFFRLSHQNLDPVLLLISSSGRSKNLVQLAREWPHDVIAFTGFDGGPLKLLAELSIHVDSDDYEVVEPVHDALLHRVQAHIRNMK